MSSFESFDPLSLRRLDDYSLELRRYEFVINMDVQREPVIHEMLGRGLARIGVETGRLGKAAGLSSEQIGSAAEEAGVILSMRLLTPQHLKPLDVLALQVASEAVAARKPKPQAPPTLADRRPDLRIVQTDTPSAPGADAPPPADPSRTIEQRLADELRRKNIKPNDPGTS
jgi:hypothetical protein